MQDDFTGDKLSAILHRVQRWPGRHRVHDAGARRGSHRTPLAMPGAAISGIAGIGHILIGVGLVLLTVMFKRVVNRKLATRPKGAPPRPPPRSPTRCWRASSFS
ncbi:MAG: DUF2871 family protein [Eggerthellaceae bacterium]